MTPAIRLDSVYVPAFQNRALAYHYKADHDHAIADYTEAIRLDPKLAPAFLQRSAAYRATGNLKRASEA